MDRASGTIAVARLYAPLVVGAKAYRPSQPPDPMAAPLPSPTKLARRAVAHNASYPDGSFHTGNPDERSTGRRLVEALSRFQNQRPSHIPQPRCASPMARDAGGTRPAPARMDRSDASSPDTRAMISTSAQ